MMTTDQMQERLTTIQQDRQTLATNIEQALAQLHAMDGQIQLLTELLSEAPVTETGKA